MAEKKEVYRLSPYLKKTIWAGKKLSRCGAEGIGEAYLLSALAGRSSRLDDGTTLRRFFARRGLSPDAFPLLVKAIDVEGALSVQVHPDKDELWLIREVYADAAVWVGFRRDVALSECREALREGRILSLLNPIKVVPGNEIMIPKGTIHGARGVTFYEIQDNRDLTFRLWDHHRGRALQIEEGLSVLDLHRRDAMAKNPFPIRFEEVDGVLPPREGAKAILCLKGKGHWGGLPFTAGDCLFSPSFSSPSLFGRASLLTLSLEKFC